MIDTKGIADGIENMFNGITGVFSVAKGKVPPDQAVELAKIESSFKLKVIEFAQSSVDSFRNFAISNEQPDRQPNWLIAWKGIIRPAYSTLLFLFFGVGISKDMILYLVKNDGSFAFLAGLPGGFWAIFGIVLGFYFGDRLVTNYLKGNTTNVSSGAAGAVQGGK